jgi:hypothetical protein
VITQDCPVGVRRRRRGAAIAAGAIASVTTAAVLLSDNRAHHTMGSVERIEEPREMVGEVELPIPAEPPVEPLPAECNAYRIELRALADCDGVPHAVVESLDAAWQQMNAWPHLPPDSLEAVGRACADARDALATANDALCPAEPAQPTLRR